MSVHLRERPVIRQALRAGLPQRLAPAALRAGAAVLGCMGACAPLLGGMHPIGLCFAMSAPTPYALYMAAGAAVGALWGLPLELAAPYLAAAATVGLLRGLAFAHRQRTAAMAPAAAGSIVFCLIASGLAVAGARGLPGVCAAAAEAMLILGASYLLAGFFLSARHGGVAAENAPWDAEDRACLCFACLSLLCCLTPYAVFGLSLAHVAAALVVLAAAGRGRQDAAAVLAVVSMLALCAADPAGLYAGLGIAAGGLVAGLFAGRPRPVTAAAFCAAGMIGIFCAPDAGAGVRILRAARARAAQDPRCAAPCFGRCAHGVYIAIRPPRSRFGRAVYGGEYDARRLRPAAAPAGNNVRSVRRGGGALLQRLRQTPGMLGGPRAGNL